MILALILFLLAGTAEAQVIGGGVSHPAVERCDYYASPTGVSGNTGLTPASPIRVQDFWRITTPLAGKALCLLDGTYQGAANVVNPSGQGAPANLSGNGTGADIHDGVCPNCITVRAMNEGRVTIDGQHTRHPHHFLGNSFFRVIGINFKRGVKGAGHVYNSSNNNIFQRLVIWDANAAEGNANTFEWVDSSNNLVEDVAIFGTGRKSFNPFGDSYNNVFRRIWARWEFSQYIGPKYCVSLIYNQSPTNPAGNIFENFLCTWSGESTPHTYVLQAGSLGPQGTLTNHNAQNTGLGLFGRDNLGTSGTFVHNMKLLGSLGYLPLRESTNPNAPQENLAFIGTSSSSVPSQIANGITFRDVVIAVHPSNPDFSSHRGFSIGSLGSNNIGERLSSLVGLTPSYGSFVDTVGNSRKHATTLASLTSQGANPWTGSSGARLCHRYKNGTLTNERLWPWPMNERIRAATAAAGTYSGPCPGCVAPGPFARTATDVMAEIEAVLGTIPAACRKP